MTNVTLSLDLTTPAGRAAMRAYLDAMEAQELKGFAEGYHRGRAIGFDDGFAAGFAGSPAAEANLPAFLRSPPPDKSDQVTGGEQPAGEEAETPPPAEVADEISSADSAAVKEIGRKLQDVVLYRNLHVVAALYVDEGGDDPNRSMSTEVADEISPAEVAAAPSTPTPVDVVEVAADARQVDPEDEDLGPVPIEEPEPEPPAPPAPVDVIDVAPEGGASVQAEAVDMDALQGDNPNRPWTPELKRAVWAQYKGGSMPAEIAEGLNLRLKRVQVLIDNIKGGFIRTPDISAPSGALAVVAPSAGALAVADRRHPAQDADVQGAWLDAMEVCERETFVARAAQPEAFAR